MNETDIAANDASELRPLIHEIRGVPVMLDRDLASIYHVMTGRLNEAIKRNLERFPLEFMFQLSKDEMDELIANCDRFKTMKHSPSRMYAFTEQGVAMLSAVLKSDVAVRESIRIIKAFVSMRRAFYSMTPLIARLELAERRQIVDQARNEERFEKIFDAMQDKTFPPQKIFFDGQFYDAFLWVEDQIKKAKSELIVIDPYFEASALQLFAEKCKTAKLVLVRSSRGKKLLPSVDIQKFNAQFSNMLEVKESDRFHDRFLIIDRKQLIHIGASLNYLGKKCFACSTFDPASIPEILDKL